MQQVQIGTFSPSKPTIRIPFSLQIYLIFPTFPHLSALPSASEAINYFKEPKLDLPSLCPPYLSVGLIVGNEIKPSCPELRMICHVNKSPDYLRQLINRCSFPQLPVHNEGLQTQCTQQQIELKSPRERRGSSPDSDIVIVLVGLSNSIGLSGKEEGDRVDDKKENSVGGGG